MTIAIAIAQKVSYININDPAIQKLTKYKKYKNIQKMHRMDEPCLAGGLNHFIFIGYKIKTFIFIGLLATQAYEYFTYKFISGALSHTLNP
jgi:hypothetical protein